MQLAGVEIAGAECLIYERFLRQAGQAGKVSSGTHHTPVVEPTCDPLSPRPECAWFCHLLLGAVLPPNHLFSASIGQARRRKSQ